MSEKIGNRLISNVRTTKKKTHQSSPISISVTMDQQKEQQQDLFKAAEEGDKSTFESLSHEQVLKSLALRNEDGRSLIHVAASFGQYEIVNVLTEADSSNSVVNSTDEEGWSPLHSATSIGNAKIVELLLSRGADVNLKNEGGRSALHYAASKGWMEIAEILISQGAKINSKDKVGCTPLHRAASTGKSEMCELLIEEGAEVDAVDRAGQSPLMTAVICGNKGVSLLLIRHGADVDLQDKEEYTVLGRASNDLRPSLIDAAKAMMEG